MNHKLLTEMKDLCAGRAFIAAKEITDLTTKHSDKPWEHYFWAGVLVKHLKMPYAPEYRLFFKDKRNFNIAYVV